jgi:hypothetical protein
VGQRTVWGHAEYANVKVAAFHPGMAGKGRRLAFTSDEIQARKRALAQPAQTGLDCRSLS